MSNLAVQNSSFGDENASYQQKAATPAAPQAQADYKGVRKAQGAFRTISEVADELDVPQHVLRFWETKFSQVKPLKRGGGRRYYRPEDVALLKHIHHLLYTEGYTIKGVQKLLKGQGRNQIAAQVAADEENAPMLNQPKVQAQESAAGQPAAAPVLSGDQRTALEAMLSELKAIRALLPAEA